MGTHSFTLILQGSIPAFFNSIWLYILIGLFFFAIFITGLLLFIPKNKRFSRKRIPPTDSSEKSPVPEKDINELPKVIQNLRGPCRCILFAANSLHDLPITIPINSALQLAQKGKCLIIDLDTKRDAVAAVFDLKEGCIDPSLKISSFQTQIENLFVWPARNFKLLKQMNLRSILQEADKKYNYVLIYAPYLPALADRNQIASCARHAVVFTGEKNNNPTNLLDLLNSCKCKVIETY